MATTTAPEVTAEATEADRRVAPFVVVGQIGNPGRCQAWMDAADRQCSKPTDGLLCPRHRTVAAKRVQAAVAQRRADQDRRAARRAERVAAARTQEPQNRASLERVNAELERLTAPVCADRAATGGAVHPSIARRVTAQFSDSRISKVTALTSRQERLRERIALAES